MLREESIWAMREADQMVAIAQNMIDALNSGTYECVCEAEQGLQVDSNMEFQKTDRLRYDEEIRLFPNPTAGIVYIRQGISTKQEAQVEIYNLSGNLVYNRSFSGSNEHILKIDLTANAIKDGLYTVVIQTKIRVFVKKLVIVGD